MSTDVFKIMERNLYKSFRDFGIKNTQWYHKGLSTVDYKTGAQIFARVRYDLPRVVFNDLSLSFSNMSTGFFQHLNNGNIVEVYDATLLAYVKDIPLISKNDYYVKEHIKYNVVSFAKLLTNVYAIRLRAVPSELPCEIFEGELSSDFIIGTIGEVTT